MKLVENKIPPPIVLILVGIAMSLAAHSMPPTAPLSPWQWVTIAIILVLSGSFGIPAISLFRRSKTTIDPVRIQNASKIVTTGVYQITRNPMYVSLTLMLVAWALWLNTPAQILGPVFFIAFIDRFQIVPEERTMQAKFGEAYVDYKTKVRRWL